MPTEFVRVKDPDTKHEYSAPRRFAEASSLEVLPDKEAVDENGRPLPPKHHVELAKAETPEPTDEEKAAAAEAAKATGSGRQSGGNR